MQEQQSLVTRLVDHQLHCISDLRQLGLVFADDFSRLLHEHDEQLQQFLTTQKTLNEAKLLN